MDCLFGRFNFEQTKKHAALGQQLQAEERERAEQRRLEKFRERYCQELPAAEKVVVTATPTCS